MFGVYYKPEKINNVETLVGYPAVLISTKRQVVLLIKSCLFLVSLQVQVKKVLVHFYMQLF
jgi:hypothetical protein